MTLFELVNTLREQLYAHPEWKDLEVWQECDPSDEVMHGVRQWTPGDKLWIV